MSKLTTTLLITLLAVLLAACDNAAPTSPTPVSSTPAPTAPAPIQPPTREAIIVPTNTACPQAASLPTLTAAPKPTDYVPQTPQRNLPQATVTIRTACGPVTLQVEIASTPQQQEMGLMWRTDLAPNAAMLFDFGRDDATDSFWMKNTPLPLSVAFVDKDLNILVLDEMRAYDDQTYHVSSTPYRYAIEANAGFYTAHGVQVGDKIEIVKK